MLIRDSSYALLATQPSFRREKKKNRGNAMASAILNRSARKYWAEGIGTFWLVFAGIGTVLLDAATGNIGIALAFGLAVLTAIYAIGRVSGGHFNPAVSVGLAVAGRLPHRPGGPLPPFPDRAEGACQHAAARDRPCAYACAPWLVVGFRYWAQSGALDRDRARRGDGRH